ncbi:hypothetical protein NHX12_004348 [Muraenolepis orangiensis]|uniref:Endonuclease/exonuclease/phosphatase domain-containing protein n=1 Tax=Muraenolepis orangiensis TaxID=630683 RepID=A0A9Q0DVB2_9TELE|nr:hypothetical protein NHX12_004348 [Muraenolepis orangiensis]
MGDFNAKIGGRNEGYEEVMGKDGVGNINENGEMFVETCVNNNLVIGGIVFPHKTIHKTTHPSADPSGQQAWSGLEENAKCEYIPCDAVHVSPSSAASAQDAVSLELVSCGPLLGG